MRMPYEAVSSVNCLFITGWMAGMLLQPLPAESMSACRSRYEAFSSSSRFSMSATRSRSSSLSRRDERLKMFS